MRIIAGEFRSRRLKTMAGAVLRPTSDRLRETLFNVLGPSVAGSVWLDCYAGSGAVGLEALSRGAAQAVFLEQARGALRVLGANITSLDVGDRARVVDSPVDQGLRRLAREGLRPGFIFLDPPYRETAEYELSLSLLGSLPLANAHTVIIVEQARRAPELSIPLARRRRLEQGDSALSFYRLK